MRLPSGRREQAPALPRFVCFGDRGEVSGNRFKRGVEVRGSPKRAESSFGGSEVVAPYGLNCFLLASVGERRTKLGG